MANSKQSKCVLAVHGYRTRLKKGVFEFELPALSVLKHLKEKALSPLYEKILLLGGHDSADLPAGMSIGMAMREWLARHNVPEYKILEPHKVTGLQRFMLPRDTAEEAMLLKRFLETPQWFGVQYHVLAAEPWRTRILHIYRELGLNTSPDCLGFVRTKIPLSLRLKLAAADLVAKADPLGVAPIGRIFRDIREQRAAALGLSPVSEQEWLIP